MTTIESWLPAKYAAAAARFDPLFIAAESKYGLPSGFLSRIAYQESRYNPSAKSPVGAIGLMQFMPATAAAYHIDPTNPAEAIDGAARFFRDLYNEFQDWPCAIAAYNWGSGNVHRWLANPAISWPQETIDYVYAVTNDLNIPVGPKVASAIYDDSGVT